MPYMEIHIGPINFLVKIHVAGLPIFTDPQVWLLKKLLHH